MRVLLRNPKREVEIAGPLRVRALLDRLELSRESVLVIRGDTLVTDDAVLADTDHVEVRPVISGGCDGHGRGWGPRPVEEAGLGGPAGEMTDGHGRGWGPRPVEEAGLGCPAGEMTQ